MNHLKYLCQPFLFRFCKLLLLFPILLQSMIRIFPRPGYTYQVNSLELSARRQFVSNLWMRRALTKKECQCTSYLKNNSFLDNRYNGIVNCRSYGTSIPTRQFSSLVAAKQISLEYEMDNTPTNQEYDNHNPVSDSPILRDLNPNQINAVTQPVYSITRVVAGPGSGKTRVLTSRIAWLLQENPSDRILAVTFTRKAAGEMEQRVHTLLTEAMKHQEKGNENNKNNDQNYDSRDGISPDGLDRVQLGTFHSICAKVLRWYGDLLSSLPSVIDDTAKSQNPIMLHSNFNIVDQSEQLRILNEVLSFHGIDKELKMSAVKPNQVLNRIAWIKSELAHGKQPFPDPGDRKRMIPKPLEYACAVYFTYRERLLTRNCLDFDDLILLTRELLMHNSDVRDRLQRTWKHVLVDEYQDTSRTQCDLIKLLTTNSLLVVGDADQSIYSWRGAHVGSLSEFETDFRTYGENSEGVTTVYLMENYRSTSNIVEAAQKIISSSKDASSGADDLRQKMIPKREAGKPPVIVGCDDAKEEAEYVVSIVQKMVKDGNYGADHSIAFIYRTNAQSRALEEACVRFNLPYVIHGASTSFYKRQEIKDSLCYLRWLYNGRDRAAMLRSFVTPKRGLGDKAIEKFDEYCSLVDQLWKEQYPDLATPSALEVLYYLSGDESWISQHEADFPPPSLTFPKRTLVAFCDFSKEMVVIRELAERDPIEKVLSYVVEKLKLVPYWDSISKSVEEFEERKGNVQELIQASSRYSKYGPCLSEPDTNEEIEFAQSPLARFLDDVSLVTDMADSGERSSDDRMVANMMTIHASKGMEFGSVFMVGLEEGTLPTSQALEKGDESVAMEEEKRLCYVAMTRAKTELYMTWRREVPLFTQSGIKHVTKKKSRFLSDLESITNSKKKYTEGIANTKTPVMTKSNSKKYPSTGLTTTSRHLHNGAASNQRSSSSWSNTHLSTDSAKTGITKKLVGTAGVYARRTSSPTFDLKSATTVRTSSSRQPPARPLSTPRKSVGVSTESRSKATTSMNTTITVKKKTENRNNIISQIKPISPKPRRIDPTWYFPIGSKVQHKKLGEGVVVVVPTSIENQQSSTEMKHPMDMDVMVRFHNGITRSFPVHGTDLSPVLV